MFKQENRYGDVQEIQQIKNLLWSRMKHQFRLNAGNASAKQKQKYFDPRIEFN